ncbi:uncharacterized protein L201_003734 [Kwoniella dendrophila CBS 6074]|uniref:Uncharacterized protein n=1 Tax=Kwoniella dendrophila CBS 6074 TaxID=1295534 RepID=A0AAX4JUE7_9TREE
MRATRQLQKLACMPKGSSRAALILQSRQASTSSEPAGQEKTSSLISELPPRLDLPESLSQSIPKTNQQGFFDSSKPPLTSSTPQPLLSSQREIDIYQDLQKLVSQPSSYRSEIGSAKIWQKYIALSPAYRKTLPIAFLQKVFQYVIPNRKHVEELSSLPEYKISSSTTNNNESSLKIQRSRLKHNYNLGNKWEKRLRTIAFDIMSTSESDKIDPKIFINGLSKLALVGDKQGCESIIREILVRYEDKLNFRQLRTMYGYGLRSCSKWLKIHSYRLEMSGGSNNKKNNTYESEILEVSEIVKRLIKSMQSKDVKPNSTTAENLLNISRLICSLTTTPETLKSFDELTEVILLNGYSIDLNNLVFKANSPEREKEILELKPSIKLSVIDYFGRKGKLYQMIASFENLFPGDLDRLPSTSLNEIQQNQSEEEEDIPTLSRLIAAEQKERAERGWFGQRRSIEDHEKTEAPSLLAESSQTEQPRGYSDYLPPIPAPYDILSPSTLSSSSSLHTFILSNIDSAQPSSTTNQHGVDGEGAVVSSILAMLSRTWLSKIKVSSNDTTYKDVSIHILRTALRAAHIEQARFIYALKEGSLTKKEIIRGPELRIEGNWFKAVWRTVRWTRNQSRRGIKFSKIIFKELNDVKNRLEQERLIYTSSLSYQQNEQSQNESFSTEESINGSLLKLIKDIEILELELNDIGNQINENLAVSIQYKTKLNSDQKVKLEEKRIYAESLPKYKRKGLSDRILNVNKTQSFEGQGSPVLA